MGWKSYASEGAMLKQMDNNAETNSRYSRLTGGGSFAVNSVCKRDLSVATPSCFTARSRRNGEVKSHSQSFHMANPNPQQTGARFKGVRDVGYKHFYEAADPLQEVIRFGRKVNYDQKSTSD